MGQAAYHRAANADAHPDHQVAEPAAEVDQEQIPAAKSEDEGDESPQSSFHPS